MNKTRLYILLFLAAYFLFSLKVFAHTSTFEPEKIRVRISSVKLPLNINAQGVMVDHMSLEGIKNASLMKDESIQIFRNKNWVIQKNKNKLTTSEKFLRLDSASGRIKIDLFWYPTPLFLSPNSSGRADIILNLSFNDYLQGVLIGEMPSHWPKEALKAQAVAARSYALSQLSRRQNDIFHLEGNVLDQVYSLQTELAREVSEVVRETQGQVLVQNKQPLKAYYHSDCGGQTEEPARVWGGHEVRMGSVKDGNCLLRKKQWQYKITKKALANILNTSEISENIKIIKSQSGRAEYIEVNGAQITGQVLREKLGFTKIKSTLFSLTFEENSVTFTGQGYGHGSGLCQWGARAMAREGKNYIDILKHYYPLAKVSPVFDSKNFATQL